MWVVGAASSTVLSHLYYIVIVTCIYVYIFVLTASAINLQVSGIVKQVGKSPESARDRQIHGEQNADGVDEQPQGKACQ